MPPPPPFPAGVPGAPGYPVPAYAMPPNSRSNGLAIASLVLGIVSVPLCFFFVPAVLAVVFGAIAIKRCNDDPAYAGKGMAIAGLVLGVVSLAVIVLLLVAGNGTTIQLE